MNTQAPAIKTVKPKRKRAKAPATSLVPAGDTTLVAPPSGEKDINPRQDNFCRFFAQNEELFGNATLSYAEAYAYKLDELPDGDEERDEKGKVIGKSTYQKAYHVCSVEGRRLLRNPSIRERIIKYRNEMMRDDVVDSELAKSILQDGDYDVKVSAIKEYNKLRRRTDGDPLNDRKPVVIVLPVEIIEKNAIPLQADATVLPPSDSKTGRT